MKKKLLLSFFIGAAIILSACSSLENKTFATANGVEAMKIETSGGVTTGTILPNLILGGAVSTIATSPAVDQGKTIAPVIAISRRISLLGEIFGLNCTQEALVYVGTPGESAAETQKRIESVKSLMDKNKKSGEEKNKSEYL